jgi:hypothetical protein
MASNDPTDTGGLFIGRRPGTAPLRYRGTPVRAGGKRRWADSRLANAILALEILVCLTLWGPQPALWLWVGSQVDYQAKSIEAGIAAAFAGLLIGVFLTLAVLVRLDRWWRLVRRAAGYEQKKGALERIFIISLIIAGSLFAIWFLLINGPGSSVMPGQQQ